MHNTPWVVFNIVCFYVVGLTCLCGAILHKTRFAARLATWMKFPRAFLILFGVGSVLLGTGWLFESLGSAKLEHAFTACGALLYVITIISFRRIWRQPPPAG